MFELFGHQVSPRLDCFELSVLDLECDLCLANFEPLLTERELTVFGTILELPVCAVLRRLQAKCFVAFFLGNAQLGPEAFNLML